MAGFNRRYAPAYQKLKEVEDYNMILMQKNRRSLPGEVRNFVFDDFIHVVDTLLFMFPLPVDTIKVQGKKINNKLYHVVLQLISNKGAIAIGIMNRDSGITEEKLEVFSPNEKRIAYDVSEVEILKEKNKISIKGNDWESTLHKRGFFQITDDFIQAVASGTSPKITYEDILLTHTICEKITKELE